MTKVRELGMKQKFVGAAFLLFSITALFVFLFFPWRQKIEMNNYLREKALALAQMAAHSSAAGLLFEDVNSVNDALAGLKNSEDVDFAVVLDADESRFGAYYGKEIREEHINDDVNIALEALQNEKPITEHKNTILVAVPIFSERNKVGYLTMGLTTKELRGDVVNSRIIASLAGLAIMLFGCVVFYFLTSRIVGALVMAVNVISSSSSEIAATVDEQERTASQQSAAVAQTTTTMEELDASSQQSSGQAESAASGALEVLSLAEQGTHQVSQAQNAAVNLKAKVDGIAEQILRLSEQTSQIQGITNLVGDIANQTNLLALNAAVEAARAGEHGRGFGVVAVEIRKLADESKKSAQKITTIVSDIQRAINSTVMATEEGTKTVEGMARISQQNANILDSIANSSNGASESVQQILLNIRQQADAVKQVVRAMNSVNTGAKETVAGIAQTKIGIRKINQASQNLADMV